MRVWLLLATLLFTAAGADPIDEFLRSPGPAGSATAAARMFAWCSARYEYRAWVLREVTGEWQAGRFRSAGREEETALGARAAGASRLQAEWLSGRPAPDPGAGPAGPDFGDYLDVVERMAVQDGREINQRLATAVDDPGRLQSVVAGLDAEVDRCRVETTKFQILRVAELSPAETKLAKSRPRMISRPGPRPAE